MDTFQRLNIGLMLQCATCLVVLAQGFSVRNQLLTGELRPGWTMGVGGAQCWCWVEPLCVCVCSECRATQVLAGVQAWLSCVH